MIFCIIFLVSISKLLSPRVAIEIRDGVCGELAKRVGGDGSGASCGRWQQELVPGGGGAGGGGSGGTRLGVYMLEEDLPPWPHLQI
jgi:hypothetical protein